MRHMTYCEGFVSQFAIECSSEVSWYQEITTQVPILDFGLQLRNGFFSKAAVSGLESLGQG